ncbi:MAG: hypothetical protein PF630_07625 [Gammaproteobacteria bacterium]|nr:hypothetical protein [Gammaproteobacteria bacterium]
MKHYITDHAAVNAVDTRIQSRTTAFPRLPTGLAGWFRFVALLLALLLLGSSDQSRAQAPAAGHEQASQSESHLHIQHEQGVTVDRHYPAANASVPISASYSSK